MVEYYTHNEYMQAKKSRNLLLTIYLISLAVVGLSVIGLLIYYILLPYESPNQLWVNIVICSITAVFLIYTYLYFTVVYKYAKSYYRLMEGIEVGLKEEIEATFISYDSEMQTKNGVECKAMMFKTEGIKHGEDMVRKVLVPYKKAFPEFKEGDNLNLVLHANILLNYEIKNN